MYDIDNINKSITRKQAVENIIEAVTVEEKAVSYIINIVSKRIQKMLAYSKKTDEIIEVINDLNSILKNLIQLQIILQLELENVRKYYETIHNKI